MGSGEKILKNSVVDTRRKENKNVCRLLDGNVFINQDTSFDLCN